MKDSPYVERVTVTLIYIVALTCHGILPARLAPSDVQAFMMAASLDADIIQPANQSIGQSLHVAPLHRECRTSY